MGLDKGLGPVAARHEVFHFMRRLVFLIVVLMGLLLGGAAAYSGFEGVSFWAGLLWSLDTVATVGSVPQAETLGGQITKVVLITLGLGTMLYVLITLTELFMAGDLSGLLEARRMQSKIAQLKDHYLICGFGRVGRQVARDMEGTGIPFVVIDDNPEVREFVDEMEVLHIEGQGSEDEVLIEAGIMRARGLIACIDSDAMNIFATLTARELRPDLHIVARAAEEPSERKLLAAGADDVVSPYKTSGRAMARLAIGLHIEEREGDGGALAEQVPTSTRSTRPQ